MARTLAEKVKAVWESRGFRGVDIPHGLRASKHGEVFLGEKLDADGIHTVWIADPPDEKYLVGGNEYVDSLGLLGNSQDRRKRAYEDAVEFLDLRAKVVGEV